ncbi:hypothetical protein CYLTODRAFT_489856 [Cylindrobasidium torrendii FP15055 ss-10]|uniref:Uncharacterized protein n=1 Tax=Cylindrobasidium torrendii FP15055 ss-10 TaxID=1314674 RepID=A0A0D7BD13_9AGAR|nr:hypothetical protein CYLTODRAFT_489856 [Cylindrobasidium torrendii FP15055 ss-10]
MSSIGNKIQGAYKAVHGAGEVLRSEAMNGLDTALDTKPDGRHERTSENGRAEFNQGVTNARTGQNHTTTSTTTTPASHALGDGRGPTGTTNNFAAAPAAAPAHHTDAPVGHHREEAMSNDPAAVQTGHAERHGRDWDASNKRY